MEHLGRWLVLIGLMVAALGGLVWLLGKLGIPLGRLPGDINFHGEHTSVHFPIVTMIVVSIVLTILLNVLLRIFHR